MSKMDTSCALNLHLSAAKVLRTEDPSRELPCRVVPFLSRLERDCRASALDSAMVATHTSNRALASALGVDERVVRGLRNGSRPLRDDRIARFGPRLRAAFGEALRGPVQLRLF